MAQACGRGRGVLRRSALTGTVILAAAPPGALQQRRGLARARWARAAHSPRRGVPAFSAVLPAAFRRHRTVRPLPPRRACAARAAPPPPACSAAGRVKGEDPGPRHFFCRHNWSRRLGSHTLHVLPKATSRLIIRQSHPVRAPGSGIQNPHPSHHVPQCGSQGSYNHTSAV